MAESAELIRDIKKHPYKIARAVGFYDVKEFPHNEWMQNIISGNGDYTLMAHRGSFKSSVLSVCIAVIMVVFPEINIIFLRKADNDVAEMVRMVKKALSSRVLQSISLVLYKRKIELREATASSVTTNLFLSASGSSQLLGIGLKSSITGKHADLVITDDICNIADRISKAERDRTKLQYQELQNIKNPGGRIINLGTKWHADDVFALMDNIQVYDYHRTGLLTEEQAQTLKDRMTPALFACNYELRIVASDDVIFASPQTGASPAMVEQGIMHLDSAFYGEDYTAWSIMRKAGDKYYLFGRVRRKHVEDCYDEILADYKRFMSGKLYNENNADKGMVGRDLRKLGIKVILYAERQNKYIKIATYLKAIWKDLVFVDGTEKEYINQVCDYNENAEHDDAPDSAASLARLLYRKNTDIDYNPNW